MRTACTLALALLSGYARGQDADADALSLPGSAPQAAATPRAWQLFVEGAAGRALVREAPLGERGRATQRLALDLQVDATLAPGLRGVLADRLDVDWQHRFGRRNAVNTLKEAYLSWQPRHDLIADLGRANQYSGIALGYNPTDYFRDGALRSLVSVDPTSVKKNRQGSVMLRGQTLWEGGSLTALYAPALREHADPSAFDPDWGATNRRSRGMLIVSQRLGADLNPQWLLYKEQGAAPQFGMSLTKLVNDSTVAYAEWSGGRGLSLLDQALERTGERAFRNRVAAGLTYTTSNKLSLSVEYLHNGAGLDGAQWQALPRQSLPAYARYRRFALSAQEMPTNRAGFFYATWRDMLVSHLDLAAMVRRNGEDRSRLGWAELRYSWRRDEVAMQWQVHSGGPFSDYGAAASRKAWQMSYRRFF